ncbi:hypothetical protein ACH4KU_01665 [Streptomyces althioticus]|uniref:hypothetical protein n=1 Tax=Streptomyces althioticus TaxID=83380 RepID=UPI003795EEA0
MITSVCAMAAGGLTTWLVVSRRARRRDERAARGEVIEVPCMLRHPARRGRWLRGRMAVGPSTVSWEPRTRAGAEAPVPSALRLVGTRAPSWREGLRVNPRCTIVACDSSVGAVEIAVMPHDLGHLLLALERTATG